MAPKWSVDQGLNSALGRHAPYPIFYGPATFAFRSRIKPSPDSASVTSHTVDGSGTLFVDGSTPLFTSEVKVKPCGNVKDNIPVSEKSALPDLSEKGYVKLPAITSRNVCTERKGKAVETGTVAVIEKVCAPSDETGGIVQSVPWQMALNSSSLP